MRIVIPVSLLLLVVLGCGNPTKVNTGDNRVATGPASTETRRVQVNQTKTFKGLEITIGEIALEPGKITVGMTLKNTSKGKLTFYPDQGSLIVGANQLDANGFMTEGNLGGEIFSGVQKSGSIAFPDNDRRLDPLGVGYVDLRLGKVFTESFSASKDVEWRIDFP